MNKMISEINNVLVDEFEIDADLIKPEANFKETLDLDSLDYVDLVVAIDSVTGVKLVEQDFKSIENFNDLYSLLFQRIESNTNQ